MEGQTYPTSFRATFIVDISFVHRIAWFILLKVFFEEP